MRGASVVCRGARARRAVQARGSGARPRHTVGRMDRRPARRSLSLRSQTVITRSRTDEVAAEPPTFPREPPLRSPAPPHRPTLPPLRARPDQPTTDSRHPHLTKPVTAPSHRGIEIPTAALTEGAPRPSPVDRTIGGGVAGITQGNSHTFGQIGVRGGNFTGVGKQGELATDQPLPHPAGEFPQTPVRTAPAPPSSALTCLFVRMAAAVVASSGRRPVPPRRGARLCRLMADRRGQYPYGTAPFTHWIAPDTQSQDTATIALISADGGKIGGSSVSKRSAQRHPRPRLAHSRTQFPGQLLPSGRSLGTLTW